MRYTSKPTWEEYRWRWAIVIAIVVGGIPIILFFSVLFNAALGRNDIPVGFIAWGIIYLIAAMRLVNFPCPRCKLPFMRSGRVYASPWAAHCVHCDWPKWKEFDANVDEPLNTDVERTECLACGAELDANQDECLSCGWSFRDTDPRD